MTLNLLQTGMEVQLSSTQPEEYSHTIAFCSARPSSHLRSDESEPSDLGNDEAAAQVHSFNTMIFR